MDPDMFDRRCLAEDVGALEAAKRRAELAPGLVPGGSIEFVLHERTDSSGEAKGEVHGATPMEAVGMPVILVGRRLPDLNETAEMKGAAR